MMLTNRLKIQEELKAFHRIVRDVYNPLEIKHIEEATELMLRAHESQKDRPDGQPYIIHPLQVATDVMEVLGIYDRDVVIGALLHDAVEDNPQAVVTYWEEKNRLEVAAEAKTPKRIQETALSALSSLFGLEVQELVRSVTNPDFNIMLADPTETKSKEELYAAHVKEIVTEPRAAIIKWADFNRNALEVRNIQNPDIIARARKKYGPVLKNVFIPFWETMPKTHPLAAVRSAMLAKAQRVWEGAYREEYYSNPTST